MCFEFRTFVKEDKKKAPARKINYSGTVLSMDFIFR